MSRGWRSRQMNRLIPVAIAAVVAVLALITVSFVLIAQRPETFRIRILEAARSLRRDEPEVEDPVESTVA